MGASNQGYDQEAPALLKRYESYSFVEAHGEILHRLPRTPSRILDIGAGTGRDAAYFADRGDSVLAVEPTRAMREGAQHLHPSPAIEWLDDTLPELTQVCARGERFDLVWLSAVWMHLDADERGKAMPIVAALARTALMFTLRHGDVPPGRCMFEATAAETIALAAREGFQCVFERRAPSKWQAGIEWTRLWFERR